MIIPRQMSRYNAKSGNGLHSPLGTGVSPLSENRHRPSVQDTEPIWVGLPKSHPTKLLSRRNKK
jgi:hypothetical protein